MLKPNKIKYNKKAQIFVISVVIAVSIALGTSFILLKYLYDSPSKDQAIGRYQSSIIESLSTANSAQAYLSNAYSQSINNAIFEYLQDNPKPTIGTLDEDGGLDLTDINYCGNYIYRVWNSNNKNCYPDISSKSFEMNKLIDENLRLLTISQKETGGIQSNKFWSVVKQPISYDYSYSVTNEKTTIMAKANDDNIVYMFINDEVANSESVKDYISGKRYDFATSGGDIPGVPFIPAGQGHYTPSDGTRQVKYIVIHATAGSTIEGAQVTFQEPGKVTSAHYIVGSTRDKYRTIQMVLDKDIAHHGGCRKTGTENVCGKEEYTFGMNKMSLGIEVVNLAHGCAYIKGYNCNDASKYVCMNDYIIGGINYIPGKNCWEKYPPEQYYKVVALTALLAKKYNVPVTRTNIIGHAEILKVGTGHVDPGPLFDMDKFVSDVQNKMSEDISKLESEVSSGDFTQCIQNGDSKWSFETVSLSSNKLTTKDVLRITTDVKNEGSGCVKLKPEIIVNYNFNGKSYSDKYSREINSYKSTDKIPTTKIAIDCSFTNSLEEYNSKKVRECILLVPSDGSEISYSLEFSISEDSDVRKYGEKLSFSAKKSESKSQTLSNSDTQLQNSNFEFLSTSQKNKIISTKNNLEKLQLIEYINEQADKVGVPREIVFGLITQESGGDMNAVSPTGAQGLFQVIQKFHIDRIKRECNSWEEFKKDAKCQVRVGIGILKGYYDQYESKGLYMKCSCDGNNYKDCKPVDTTYRGWDAALRAYNNAGCHVWADYNFVDTIMTYARGWGYSESQDQIVKEEVNQGILGTYMFKNHMQKTVDLDFNLFNIASGIAKEIVDKCSKSENRIKCIDEETSKFNNNPVYKNRGIQFDECDIDSEIKNTHKFLEELNDCASSRDDNCQCTFSFNTKDPKVNVNIRSIESSQDFTKISHSSKSLGIKNAYVDFIIYDSNNKPIVKEDVTNSYLIFYKKDGEIYQGTSGFKSCNAIKNRFRLCLYTNEDYHYYDKNSKKMVYSKFMIPFTITLRDGTTPKIIEGFSQMNMPNDKNSVVLKWTPGIEEDISSYNIYFADNIDRLKNTQTIGLRDNYYKTIDISNKEYEEYNSIDFANPRCELQDLSDGTSVDQKYCIFKYDAIDKNEQSVSITISKEKLYYIKNENKFLYILDGNLVDNNLESGVDRFAAITAVDIDGMEIDNLNTNQKFDDTKNIVKMTPENNLAPGFSIIKNLDIETIEPNNYIEVIQKKLILSWTKPTIYIDGTPIGSNVNIKYNVYMSSQNTCFDNTLVKLDDFDDKSSYNDLEAEINIKNNVNIYCVGISSFIEDNSAGLKENSYDAVIGRSLNMPENSFYNIGN